MPLLLRLQQLDRGAEGDGHEGRLVRVRFTKGGWLGLGLELGLANQVTKGGCGARVEYR